MIVIIMELYPMHRLNYIMYALKGTCNEYL